MVTTCRLNSRQKTSSEKMFTIICTVYFGTWFNDHNTSFFIRDTPTDTMIPWLKCSRSRTSLFWNLLYLSFNRVCTIILRIDCRGSCECIFVWNQMLCTLKLISLGNHLSSCWLRCKQFHLQFSLSIWTITLLYVASCQSQEIDEIKMS